MEYYVVNNNVLFFENSQNRRFNTFVIEKNRKIQLYIYPLQLIKKSCKWYGNSYNIQRDFVIDKFNFYIKTPIIVSNENSLIFFPTATPKSNKCIWICYNNVERYIKENKYTKIFFKGGKSFLFPISYTTIDNQITKCIKIEKKLNDFLIKRQ